MRGAYLKGASLADMWQPLLAMVAFAVVISAVAFASFNKRLSE
jgi:hypothetical protein